LAINAVIGAGLERDQVHSQGEPQTREKYRAIDAIKACGIYSITSA
jgi:hypothetical protein